mmetsp:Transcript_70015/g.160888  ORF Transcript_70015/g.160888 Transcript_70015/m.160888 type:complete len:282 (-) Transcript_70015:49-894(-)
MSLLEIPHDIFARRCAWEVVDEERRHIIGCGWQTPSSATRACVAGCRWGARCRITAGCRCSACCGFTVRCRWSAWCRVTVGCRWGAWRRCGFWYQCPGNGVRGDRRGRGCCSSGGTFASPPPAAGGWSAGLKGSLPLFLLFARAVGPTAAGHLASNSFGRLRLVEDGGHLLEPTRCAGANFPGQSSWHGEGPAACRLLNRRWPAVFRCVRSSDACTPWRSPHGCLLCPCWGARVRQGRINLQCWSSAWVGRAWRRGGPRPLRAHRPSHGRGVALRGSGGWH